MNTTLNGLHEAIAQRDAESEIRDAVRGSTEKLIPHLRRKVDERKQEVWRLKDQFQAAVDLLDIAETELRAAECFAYGPAPDLFRADRLPA